MKLFPHSIVVHEDAQPGFDGLHDILKQMLLNIWAVIECKISNMDGTSNIWQSHKHRKVLLVWRFLF